MIDVTLTERLLAVATADGTMDTFIVHPNRGGPFPAVVVYMDALGIREELRQMTRRIAAAGYFAMLPGLFYRDGNPSFDPARLADGFHDPEMLRLNASLSHAQVLADTEALFADATRDSTVRRDAFAAVGYCMGGRHAYAAAAHFGNCVRAACSVHGGRLVTDRADSPHLQTQRIRGEIHFAFADNDPAAPPEHAAILGELLARFHIAASVEIHEGAQHGFIFPERHCFHRVAAERVWERMLDLFRRRL